MVMKTVSKKICKQFFADEFQGIEALDNENYDIDNVVIEDMSWVEEIMEIQTVEELKEYYLAKKGK